MGADILAGRPEGEGKESFIVGGKSREMVPAVHRNLSSSIRYSSVLKENMLLFLFFVQEGEMLILWGAVQFLCLYIWIFLPP